MVRLDAEYMFSNEFPDVYAQYKKMEDIAIRICKNPANRVIIEQNPYLLDFQQMLWQEAFARSEGRHLLASITL